MHLNAVMPKLPRKITVNQWNKETNKTLYHCNDSVIYTARAYAILIPGLCSLLLGLVKSSTTYSQLPWLTVLWPECNDRLGQNIHMNFSSSFELSHMIYKLTSLATPCRCCCCYFYNLDVLILASKPINIFAPNKNP